MLRLIWVVFVIVSSHRSKSNLTGEFHLLVNVAVACFDHLLIHYYPLLDSHSPQIPLSEEIHAFTSLNRIRILALFLCWSIFM